MALPTPSAEYKRILASKKCPRCGAKIISRFNSRVRIFKGDGSEVDMPTKISDVFSFSAFTAIADAYKIAFDKNRDAVAACPECDYRWPVYEGGSMQEELRFNRIVETHRTMEPLGVEERTIDNSTSSVGMSRRLSITRDWIQTFHTSQEEINKAGVQLGIEAVNLKLSAEKSLRTAYEQSATTARTYSDELTLQIPAQARIRLMLHWKRIWQHGYVSYFAGQSSEEIKVPFQLIVGVTFDQSAEDITSKSK